MSVCGYFDRFHHDKAWWVRWCALAPGHRGDHHVDRDLTDVADTFAALNAWRAETFGVTVDEADVAPRFTVTTPGREVFQADLKGTPLKVFKWVAGNSAWVLRAAISETLYQPIFYAADSKTGLARKGDVKTGETAKTHTSIQAVMVHERKRIADFSISWETIDGKTNLVDISLWDQFTKDRIIEKQMTPFQDWLRVLAPVGAPKPRAVKPIAREKTDMELIAAGEWIAE